jgi:hypothetical protein
LQSLSRVRGRLTVIQSKLVNCRKMKSNNVSL